MVLFRLPNDSLALWSLNIRASCKEKKGKQTTALDSNNLPSRLGRWREFHERKRSKREIKTYRATVRAKAAVLLWRFFSPRKRTKVTWTLCCVSRLRADFSRNPLHRIAPRNDCFCIIICTTDENLMGVNPQSFIIRIVCELSLFFFLFEKHLNDNICDCFRSVNFFKINFEREERLIYINYLKIDKTCVSNWPFVTYTNYK